MAGSLLCRLMSIGVSERNEGPGRVGVGVGVGLKCIWMNVDNEFERLE